MQTNPFDNAMRRQVWSLPELILQQYDDLEPKTRRLLATPEIFALQKILLTGCGDSYAAALATQGAFAQLTGIPVEVVSAIDMSRYYPARQIGNAPLTPLLIAVSNSGAVARVAEAALRVNHHGGFTVAITGNATSPLGRACARLLKLDIPDFETAPGIRSYLVAVLALLLLAIRIGEVRGRYPMDAANAYRQEIRAGAARLMALLPSADAEIRRIAEQWRDCRGFDFIGAGPDDAAAWYGHAKIWEATGRYAMHINTEEWLHLNFFCRDVAGTGAVMVVSKNSPAMSRAQEVAHHIVTLGRPLMILTDAAPETFPAEARCIATPESDLPWLAPLTQWAPLALLAGYLAAMLGEEYGRGGRGPWRSCQNGATTKDSQIILI